MAVRFRVGWNTLGGRRLWLADRHGNLFYFAHLAGFSPLAKEGAQVRRGDVIGFVGTSGDAQGTPPHLHFQIIRDLGGREGDYPGVCKPSEAAQWLAGSPDPNLLLRIAALEALS